LSNRFDFRLENWRLWRRRKISTPPWFTTAEANFLFNVVLSFYGRNCRRLWRFVSATLPTDIRRPKT